MKREPLRSIAADRGLVGGPFGSSLVNADYTDDGIPVIRGANMSAGRFVGGEFAFVSQEKFARDLSRNSAAPRDVIYTQRGTLGQVALVPSTGVGTFVVSQSQMRLRVDPQRAVPEFVYYASTTSDFLKQVDDRAISTGVPHTNLGILAELEIPLPPLAEQQAIAEVLGALDDKIAANTALADKLLEVVNTEFLSRFGTRDLDVPLGSLAEVVDCLHSKKPERLPEGPTLMQLNNIRDDGLVNRTSEYRVSVDDYERWSRKFETRPWDLVITNVGRIGAVARIPDRYTVAIGRNMTGIRPKDVSESGSFLAAALLSSAVRREIDQRTDAGSVMSALNVRSVPLLRLHHSTSSERASFHEFATAFFEKADVALVESAALVATRDALLPQLMSGKLRVRDAEAAASEADA